MKLEDLSFYTILNKHHRLPVNFMHLIENLKGDAETFLEQIPQTPFPITKENLSYSWRLLKQVESILTDETRECFSDIEIFTLIISAIFHDVPFSLLQTDETSGKLLHIRKDKLAATIQHLCTENQLMSEVDQKLFIDTVLLILEFQNMSWEEFLTNTKFRKTIKISGQNLRASLLAAFIRIGDLLDLDDERHCNILKKRKNRLFDQLSTPFLKSMFHQVKKVSCTPYKISIIVQTENKEAHILWSEWLGYLKEDILQANTIVFTGDLKPFQLPIPDIQIEKHASANYNIWPLRFELDDTGRIWNIISQAIYTSRFDFVREMIQNAIDAALYRIYDDSRAQVPHISPRSWQLENYQPEVLILYSEKNKIMVIQDNGIGMDENVLQYFLFKIAQTGYEQLEKHHEFQFPSIAKFGIGFISILLRADKVVITTKSQRQPLIGRQITLQTDARNAYSEQINCAFGTNIQLFLKEKYPAKEMLQYLQENYSYPSVPLFYIDLDKLATLTAIAGALKIDFPGNLTAPDLNQVQIPYSQLQPAIETLYSSVKNDLEKEETDDTKADQPLADISHLIYSRDFINDVPELPFLFYFDNQFNIIKIEPITEMRKISVVLGLVFIPIKLIDYESGIEWKSIHGFLIHKNDVKKSLIRYSGIADEFDDPDKMIFLSQEQLDDADYYDEEKMVIDTLDVMRKFRNERRKKRDSMVRSMSENYEEIFILNDQIFSRFDEFDNYLLPFIEKKASRVRKESADLEHYKYLNQVIENYNNDVYQDGIKTPVRAWSIAPLGMCRAVCNLTADARFTLNVTRNAINESPVILSRWIATYGQNICTQILEIVKQHFSVLNLNFKVEELIPKTDTKSHIIFNYSRSALLKKKD